MCISNCESDLFSLVCAVALQHAGKHMEDSIVASYTALLLGCLCQGSQVRISDTFEHNTIRFLCPTRGYSVSLLTHVSVHGR